MVVLTTIFATEYAVMLALPWLLPHEPPRLLEAAVDAVTLIAVLAPVIWWTVVRPLQEVILLRTRFLTDLFSRIETDRRGTAHELHDGVGQSLSLLVAGLRSAQESAVDPEAAARREHLLKLAREALREVKRLALGLRPSLLDDLGLAPALQRLADDVREHYPVELTLDTSEVAGVRFPEPVETAVFRIVQEALANVVTHSGAGAASVAVRRRGGELRITVTDDGCGFDPSDDKVERVGHLGLIGMKERAKMLGGEFAIHSARGQGTRLTATISVGG
jgi:signal transduction histidine kinase